ncbi:Protein gts1 [Sporothrix epigloea]|uniref:Protein gts1 n=1 Tax=Sporothrix epigloea TaxID=1892477 RepID=A0ABP0DM57_9PEZI
MTSAPSKRQQARNERALQDLVQSVPGNNTCADCQTRNPAWASWNLGIFLCMRCAAIHRKLGTHVSKVKSLSMDGWSAEQVVNMRKVGNTASNKVYNPAGQKSPVPIDADEADAAMERFIRQKYVNKAFSESTNSLRYRKIAGSDSDDLPPPLPPKTPGSFTRSVSSSFIPSSKVERVVSSTASSAVYGDASGRFENHGRPPVSPLPHVMSHSRPESSETAPRLRSKISQVFGSSKHSDVRDNLTANLASLREMGFADDRRNTVVLKSVSWDLEKAIEILVRMGDAGVSNGRLSPHPFALPRESSRFAPTRTFSMPTQVTTAASGLDLPPASFQKSQTFHLMGDNSNPFVASSHALPSAPLQSSWSTEPLQNESNYHSTNPFGIMSTPQQLATSNSPAPTVASSASASNLHESFQRMALSSPNLLFPHYTSNSVPQQQPQMAQSSYITPSAEEAFLAVSPAATTQHKHSPQLVSHSNPFSGAGTLQYQQQWPQSAQTPSGLMTGDLSSNNPFSRSPTHVQSPNALGQIPEQSHTSYFTTLPLSQTYLPSQSSSTTSPQSFPHPSSQQFPQQLQVSQQQSNNPFIAIAPATTQSSQTQNTASIMPFYSIAQSRDLATSSGLSSLTTTSGQPTAVAPLRLSDHQANNNFLGRILPENSSAATSPGATNPFFNMSTSVDGASTLPTQQAKMPNQHYSALHAQRQSQLPFAPSSTSSAAKGANAASLVSGGRSRDSMMALGMEWSNGRHSPDAFVSLSAHH